MGSFIITKRLGIDPSMFDAAQIAYVLLLLLTFAAAGEFARRAAGGNKYGFRVSIGLATFFSVAVCLYIGSKFRVPSFEYLPDLVFSMLSFTLGFHLYGTLDKIGFFAGEPELTPAEIRVKNRLDALVARQSDGDERPIFTEALAFMPFCH